MQKIITFIFVTFTLSFLVWKGVSSSNSPSKLKKPSYITPYNFTLHKTSKYHLNFLQTSIISLDKRVPLSQKFELDASLYFQPLEKDKQSIWILMQLDNIQLTSSTLTHFAKEELTKLYSKLFIVEMSLDGEIIDIYFHGLEKNYHSLKQSLFLMQIINKAYKYYEVNEFDTNGKYKATYTKQGLQITKHINAYYPDENQQNFILLDNNFSANIDNQGDWLQTLTIKHNLKSTSNDFKNINNVTLKKVDTQQNLSLAIFLNQKSIATLLKEFSQNNKNETDIWQSIKEKEEKEILEKNNITLDNVMQTIIKKPQNTQNYLLLSKYLKAYPKSISELVQNFDDYDDYIQMSIISILEFIGTPEAEEALIALSQDNSLSSTNQVRSIAAIGSLKKPSQKSIERIKELINERDNIQDEDLPNTAILAFGTLKQTTKNTEITSDIKTLFEEEDTPNQRKVTLYAIQNAGVDDFIEEVQKELQSKSYRNRILALQTLSAMKDQEQFKNILLEQKKLQTNKYVLKEISHLLHEEE